LAKNRSVGGEGAEEGGRRGGRRKEEGGRRKGKDEEAVDSMAQETELDFSGSEQ
jgi:hypothetical protein